MAVVSDALDVILRDGTTLRLRSPRAADQAVLLSFFSGLSQQSLYLRFHGVGSVGPPIVEAFLDPDWVDRGALIGTLADGAGERVVALAVYARLRDPARAEVAFVVADAFQGRGIGTRMLERLAALAADQGIDRFVAEVLSENTAMLRVLAEAGFEAVRRLDGSTVEVEFGIAATEAYRDQVDRRDHVAVVASLRPFFDPASVAVIGASPRRGSIGEAVAGVPGYGSVEEIPGPVDLAVVSLPGDLVVDAAAAALREGVRALVVISAGFAELGREGVERQDRLLALVRAHGARLIGPNCLGIAVTSAKLNSTFAPHGFPPGNVAFSSQSGALGLALLEQAEEKGLGFSAFVSIGNKADVSSNDLLEYWEDDPETDVILLYLESFGNPRKFGRIARRIARRKPILAMKSGVTRAGARAASSHTAALAGSEAAVDALFRQAGVIRSGSLEELIDVAAVLSTQPLPRGRRVAVLTNAGGLGILCADACDAAGLELPPLSEETRTALRDSLPPEASVANPIDMLGSATAASYENALPVLLADPAVDAVIVLFVPAARIAADDVSAAVARVTATGESGKPVLPVLMAAERPPGAFPYPESAARALGRAAERAEWLRRPAGSPSAVAGLNPNAARAVLTQALAGVHERWLEPVQVRELLDAYGIPLVEERLAADANEAAAVAEDLGFPVAAKSAVAGAHKTERGGVALGLETAEAVRVAVERIGGSVVIQPMVKGGVEFLAGVVQDPVFGPLVAFGPGGVLAELIGEAGFRLAPLTDVDAEELVRVGKTGQLVRGFRGAPPLDAQALADLLCRLSALGEDLPEVVELDLNPVIALPHGCVAVDARVRVQRVQAPKNLKTW
jgi:acyl-CoA synthetase (NDP forming)/RimJ/RimL family protein N-acetyltransferase